MTAEINQSNVKLCKHMVKYIFKNQIQTAFYLMIIRNQDGILDSIPYFCKCVFAACSGKRSGGRLRLGSHPHLRSLSVPPPPRFERIGWLQLCVR